MTTFLRFGKFIIALYVLTACAALGSWDIWISTASPNPTAGALNVGGVRPPILANCNRPRLTPYDNPCTYAFADSQGKKVNVLDDLLKSIDASAEKIAQLKPWITKIGSKEDSGRRSYEHKMFLLTISPAIILVVPNKNKWPDDICSTLFLQGCIQSQSFRGNAFWFRGAPKISEDSFWFSPEDVDGKIHAIDSISNATDIRLKEAVVRLTRAGAEWQVERLQ